MALSFCFLWLQEGALEDGKLLHLPECPWLQLLRCSVNTIWRWVERFEGLGLETPEEKCRG